jgi:hypothetical protein
MRKAREASRAQARPCESDSPNAIRAELIGNDTATGAGISITAYTPVLELCRRLVAAGHDPATPLQAYRGPILCLKVRSIGEAAGLRIAPTGVGFKRLPPSHGSTASPIAGARPGTRDPDAGSAGALQHLNHHKESTPGHPAD